MFAVDEMESCELPLLYSPASPTDPKHPYVTLQKNKRREARRSEVKRHRTKKWLDKSRLVRRSYKNEQATRDAIIRATRQSGSVLHDGDSRLGPGAWGIDDKLQTKATSQFVVKIETIHKAEAQKCVTIITTGNREKFVVASLPVFCEAAQEFILTCKNIASQTGDTPSQHEVDFDVTNS